MSLHNANCLLGQAKTFSNLLCLIFFVLGIITFTKVVKVQHGEDNVVQFVGDIEQITPEQVFSVFCIMSNTLMINHSPQSMGFHAVILMYHANIFLPIFMHSCKKLNHKGIDK